MVLDTGVDRKSATLEAKRIGLGICGGIGAVETVKLIRELRRHGAEIATFSTPSARRFITDLSLSWAAQGPVIGEATEDVEHLDPFDLVVVAPVTLNTLSKSALGIADNAVCLLIAGQLGRKGKLAFVPTMNALLLQHPLYREYRARLEAWGALFYPSPFEEGRLKMPAPEAFATWVVEVLHAS